MDQITHITPSPRQPKRLQVRVGKRSVGTLPASVVAELGLEVGQAWDEALAQRVGEAVECDEALRRGARFVDRRPRSRAEVEAKLHGWGYGEAVVQGVLARMAALGLIDDAALGRALVDEVTRRVPAGPALLRAKLERKGLSADEVESTLSERAAEGPNDVAAATELARRKLASMGGLDPLTRRRRLTGLLARRGFDEETVEDVLRSLGEIQE